MYAGVVYVCWGGNTQHTQYLYVDQFPLIRNQFLLDLPVVNAHVTNNYICMHVYTYPHTYPNRPQHPHTHTHIPTYPYRPQHAHTHVLKPLVPHFPPITLAHPHLHLTTHSTHTVLQHPAQQWTLHQQHHDCVCAAEAPPQGHRCPHHQPAALGSLHGMLGFLLQRCGCTPM